MPISKVISGGQTGADMAGLIAARSAGLLTGGIAPRGYRTELGPRVELLKSYGLVEHFSSSYEPRTFQNILDSTFTLIIADRLDGGSALTVTVCLNKKKPSLHIPMNELYMVQTFTFVKKWIEQHSLAETIINVAGNRESKSPGIEKAATIFLAKLFGAL